jgi:hypothetical protein
MMTITPSAQSLAATIDSFLHALTEVDVAKRDALIAQACADDCRLIEPHRSAKGHPGISRMAAVNLVEFPGYAYRRIGAVEPGSGVSLCFTWHLIRPDGMAAIGGVDVATRGPDGRLRQITRRFEHRAGAEQVEEPMPCTR